MLLRNVKTEPAQLLSKLSGRTLRAIRQKQKLFVIFIKPIYKLDDSGYQTVTVIDNSIHIANKGFFFLYIFDFGLSYHLVLPKRILIKGVFFTKSGYCVADII